MDQFKKGDRVVNLSAVFRNSRIRSGRILMRDEQDPSMYIIEWDKLPGATTTDIGKQPFKYLLPEAEALARKAKL